MDINILIESDQLLLRNLKEEDVSEDYVNCWNYTDINDLALNKN